MSSGEGTQEIRHVDDSSACIGSENTRRADQRQEQALHFTLIPTSPLHAQT